MKGTIPLSHFLTAIRRGFIPLPRRSARICCWANVRQKQPQRSSPHVQSSCLNLHHGILYQPQWRPTGHSASASFFTFYTCLAVLKYRLFNLSSFLSTFVFLNVILSKLFRCLASCLWLLCVRLCVCVLLSQSSQLQTDIARACFGKTKTKLTD